MHILISSQKCQNLHTSNWCVKVFSIQKKREEKSLDSLPALQSHGFVIKWYYPNLKKLKSKSRTEVNQRNETAAVRTGLLWHRGVLLAFDCLVHLSKHILLWKALFSCWSPACVGAWKFSIPEVQVWICFLFCSVLWFLVG